MNHKGTLTTRPEIFTELLFDVCDSLRRAGIPRLLALNGHAGNIRPVRERLDDLRARLRGRPGDDYDRARLTFATTEQARADRTLFEEAKLATAAKGAVMIDAAIAWTIERLQELLAGSRP
jgi:creatinine amidohydrolase/Fe(II)-dependent formamide hydrolase-like protein